MSKYLHWTLLGLVLASSFGLMLHSSLSESAIMDELAHIPAGYGYARYLDYRLNPEHPPLVKAIAAIPLLFQNLKFPAQSDFWQKEINGQWTVGDLFLYGSGNNADKIINWARLGPILLTLLLIVLVYFWSKELVGKWWAFLPATLTAFSPAMLAHGHYVTTDVGATLGISSAIYFFVRYLNGKSKKNFMLAGLSFGVAQLMKFSAVLLLPLFIFLLLAYSFALAFKDSESLGIKIIKFIKEFLKHIGLFIGILAIAYILVYLVYFVFTINYPVQKQFSDTATILTSFADGPDPGWSTCKPAKGMAFSRHIRCLADINIWMTKNKILRPLAQYVLGVLMVMQRSSGGNTGYFMGEVSAGGWWYYFPIVFLLKEPLPSLILIALAFLAALFKFINNFKFGGLKKRFLNYLRLNFAEFSMLSFIIFYWLYSIKSPLNIGVRHILPTIPLIYILSTEAIKNWIRKEAAVSGGFFKTLIKNIFQILKNSAKISFVIVLTIWFIIESLITAPHFLSYFNELAGGTWNGYKYVTDSNYDWGQDMRALVKLADEKKMDKIAVDYFGGANIGYYLGSCSENSDKRITPRDKTSELRRIAETQEAKARRSCAVPWSSLKGNPKYQGINWLAVSINTLQSATQKTRRGFERKPEDEYRWLQKIKNINQPDYRAGTTIFVYKLTNN